MARRISVWSGILTFSVCLPIGVRTGAAGSEHPNQMAQDSAWEKVWQSPGFEAGFRGLSEKVDMEQMSRHLFYLAKDPLPYRKLNSALQGHTKSTLEEADDFLVRKLESWGYGVQREGVRVQAFRCDTTKPKQEQYSPPKPDDPWYTAYNLYAERRGSSHPDEIILLLAHKDSQSWVDSPGANDNAIGTVCVLEIARVFADRSPNRTIRFLFCNEEHTPWTSVTAARDAKKRGDRIAASINLDGVGGKPAAAGGRPANFTAYTKPAGLWLADLMNAVNARFAIGLEERIVKRDSPGDDDGSFVNAGYPAAIVNIGSWPYGDPNYHAEGDIPEKSDLPTAVKVVRATLAAVLSIDEAGELP